MVAYIVDVECLFLAVLDSCIDAADIGLADSSRSCLLYTSDAADDGEV